MQIKMDENYSCVIIFVKNINNIILYAKNLKSKFAKFIFINK